MEETYRDSKGALRRKSDDHYIYTGPSPFDPGPGGPDNVDAKEPKGYDSEAAYEETKDDEDE